MRGLRGGACVEGSSLVAKVTLTIEFDGKPVDMVETFGSIKGWGESSRMVQDGLGYLRELPDLAVGLPAQEHVILSPEELEAVHHEYKANDCMVSFALLTLAECLNAISQVVREHPDTCGISADLGEQIREWVDCYSNHMGPNVLRFPPTKATRIQDLKFILVQMTRFPGKTEGVKTFSAPTLQQCNLDTVSARSWHQVRATLDCHDERLLDPKNDIHLQIGVAMPWEMYEDMMGELAVEYRHAIS
ncbi:hypothetical protein GNI_186730 [Gregarina niphandrodes]|uniref:Uncharacterized protein n=1 Tax=Gregarina niphandrodes TaxID=110365 RepID=A0A023AXV9_GRENI|nr:hypothetical protein GNI_186730 [Gregarina niphandrodes]EZG43120.1 hypothetical protein GNI_186730 [Gregarina niphandrodes]|eukprot:XP_011133620.1 hypothetical protein GNI_186730 [Gregarina niphandrodes]